MLWRHQWRHQHQKYFFLHNFYSLSISDAKMNLSKIFRNFLNGRQFEARVIFQTVSCTGSRVLHQDRSCLSLHFELLFNVLVIKLAELWRFQLWPNCWPRDLIIWHLTQKINGALALAKIHIWVKFGDDWSNGATCILLTTFRTDKQIDRQTDRQTVRRTYLTKLKILASNNNQEQMYWLQTKSSRTPYYRMNT